MGTHIEQRPAGMQVPAELVAPSPRRSLLRSLRAWMIVPVVDVAMVVTPALWAPEHVRALLAIAVITVVLLSKGRTYRARLHQSVLDELPWLAGQALIAVAVVATVKALRHEPDVLPAFLQTSFVALLLLVAGRVVTTQVVLFGRRRGLVAHRTLVIGSDSLAMELGTILERYPQYGLTLHGFVADDDLPIHAAPRAPRLGTVRDLERIVATRRIQVLLVASGGFDEEQLMDAVQRPVVRGCQMLVVPRLHLLRTHAEQPDHIGSIPIMRIIPPSLTGVSRALKRGSDVAVAALTLLLLAPILLVCAVAVRIEGGPGVLFRQERVGLDGRTFGLLKFRSMKPATAAESDTRWSIAADDRVGPVGRVLRRTSLDELPQLWNILRGDMTLVGPRPERPHFVDKFTAEIPRYGHRHRVRAGLTGYAQVSGLRGNTPIDDRARFDNYYIENWSLWMDVKVVLRTFGEVLFAKGR